MLLQTTVLTAAHCAANSGNPSQYSIVPGDYDLSNDNDVGQQVRIYLMC